MSNKQSSVNWLFCQLIDKEYKNPHDTELISIIEQAKEMHKEEIIDAHFDGRCDETEYYSLEIATEYYNETFGDNK